MSNPLLSEEVAASVGLKQEAQYIVHQIKMAEVHYDEVFNVRGKINRAEILTLADSVKKRGLDSPVTVRPMPNLPNGKKWHLVAGHRRFKSFEFLERTEIPAFIRQMSDQDAHKLNLEENLQRQDLNILQEAKGLKYFADIIGEASGKRIFNDAAIADMFSRSIPWVKVRLDLLQLPKDVQELAADGTLSQDQVKQVAKLRGDEPKMYDLVRRMKDLKASSETPKEKKSVKKTESVLKAKARDRTEMLEMNGLIWDMTGPGLHTRMLAWAAGEISSIALWDSIRKHCSEQNPPIKFEMPAFIKEALLKLQSQNVS